MTVWKCNGSIFNCGGKISLFFFLPDIGIATYPVNSRIWALAIIFYITKQWRYLFFLQPVFYCLINS